LKAQDARDRTAYARDHRDRASMLKCCTTQGAQSHICRESDKGKLLVLLTGLSDRDATRNDLIKLGFNCRDIDGGDFEVLEVRW